MYGFIFLAVCVCLMIWYFISIEFYEIAEMKGYYNQKKYLFLTFFFGIVGILLIIALPDRGQVITAETSKQTQADGKESDQHDDVLPRL